MRITVICAYYPSHGGGMEMATERLVHYFTSGGHDVRWVAQKDGALPLVSPADCCPIDGSDIVYRLSGVPLPLPYPSAAPSLIRHIRWSELIVIAEANFIISAISFLIAKSLGKKVVLIQHVGKPSTASPFAHILSEIAEFVAVRPMLSSADRVVFVSPSVAAYFNDVKFKFGAGTIIGHSIDTDVFHPASTRAEWLEARAKWALPLGGPIACFVGRLTRTKGVGVIEELARNRPDWTFAIAGIGPADPSSWGLPNVLQLGQIDPRDVSLLYQASNVCILPSQSESFSLVVREALACGCAVICAEQILETDPNLARFVKTVEVDLTDIINTAKRFSFSLEDFSGYDPSLARQYIISEFSPVKIRDRYQNVINEIIKNIDENIL